MRRGDPAGDFGIPLCKTWTELDVLLSSSAVVADEDGYVVFEWWEGQKKLTVHVHPKIVEYVKVWGPDIFSEMEDSEAERIEDRRILWRWLTG